LSEAGVLPEEREPTPISTWIKRGVLAAALLIGVSGAAWWGMSNWSTSQQQNLVKQALAGVSVDTPKLGGQNDAAVFLYAGEYTLRTGAKDSAKEARDEFRSARALLAKVEPSVERDCLLIDLAVRQTELGGDETEVKKGQRLRWDDAQHELRETLRFLSHLNNRSDLAPYGPRAKALRQVCRRLLERNEPQVAYSLAVAVASDKDEKGLSSEIPEALGIAGLEFLRAGDTAHAEQLAQTALRTYRAAPAQREGAEPSATPLKTMPDAPAVVALALALGIDEIKNPPESLPRSAALAVGKAIDAARRNNLEEARDLARSIVAPEMRLNALVALAEAGDAGPALDLADEQVPNRTLYSKWQLLRLAQAAAKSNRERVWKLAEIVNDPDLTGRIQLAALEAQIADGKTDTAAADQVADGTPAHALARLLVVRKATANGTDMKNEVDKWTSKLQPFGYIGVALGRQDRERK
jgi:hypothetical protein